MAKKRPEVLQGKTHRFETQCGKLYLTLNEMDGELVEIQMKMGKSGTCVRSLLEIISVLFSMLLQSDIEKDDLKKNIKNTLLDSNCGMSFIHKGETYKSCVDLVAERCLEMLEKEKTN